MYQELIGLVTEKVKEALLHKDAIPVEVSARHVHLSEEHRLALFGEAPLTRKKELSQPGQYQCCERVRLIGPKGMINGVAILGPCREHTQVEISGTDAFSLGIDPPVRDSGELSGSGSIFIASGKEIIKAQESVIIARRHIHMTEEDADRFGLQDRQTVKAKVWGSRPLIFEDVLVRVNAGYRLALHIDFDEANASGCGADTFCRIL